MRVVAALIAAVATVAPAARLTYIAPAAPITYRPPVDGPVLDWFRPPASGYGPGNRGLELAAAPGEVVRAPAAGTVTFAGRVGRDLHVVIAHPDGLRTTVGFLASTTVHNGQRLEAGDPVGTASASVHFGARAGDVYVDPSMLLGGRRRVRLVPLRR